VRQAGGRHGAEPGQKPHKLRKFGGFVLDGLLGVT